MTFLKWSKRRENAKLDLKRKKNYSRDGSREAYHKIKIKLDSIQFDHQP